MSQQSLLRTSKRIPYHLAFGVSEEQTDYVLKSVYTVRALRRAKVSKLLNYTFVKPFVCSELMRCNFCGHPPSLKTYHFARRAFRKIDCRVHLGRNQRRSTKKSEPNFSIQKHSNTDFALAIMRKSQAYQKFFLHQSRVHRVGRCQRRVRPGKCSLSSF